MTPVIVHVYAAYLAIGTFCGLLAARTHARGPGDALLLFAIGVFAGPGLIAIGLATFWFFATLVCLVLIVACITGNYAAIVKVVGEKGSDNG